MLQEEAEEEEEEEEGEEEEEEEEEVNDLWDVDNIIIADCHFQPMCQIVFGLLFY